MGVYEDIFALMTPMSVKMLMMLMMSARNLVSAVERHYGCVSARTNLAWMRFLEQMNPDTYTSIEGH